MKNDKMTLEEQLEIHEEKRHFNELLRRARKNKSLISVETIRRPERPEKLQPPEKRSTKK